MDDPKLTCNCKNCKVVQRFRQGMLGLSRPAGPGYTDGDVQAWNSTLKDYPCLVKQENAQATS